MSNGKEFHSIDLSTRCSQDKPEGSSRIQVTTNGDFGDPKIAKDARNGAKNAEARCRDCHGHGCQTWELANATNDQITELISSNAASLPSGQQEFLLSE